LWEIGTIVTSVVAVSPKPLILREGGAIVADGKLPNCRSSCGDCFSEIPCTG